jgi:D-alanyl-D-alanine carboxypeptidase/D-alanyl-D-alanine-endopeptidase (penicillin-binding protein 4)
MLALLAGLALVPPAALAARTSARVSRSAAAAARSGATGVSGRTGSSGASGSSGSTGSSGPRARPFPAAAVALLRSTLANAMRPLGGGSGAYVVDLATGQVLFDEEGSIPRAPASVEKLYTLATVLARLGPERTLSTQVYASGAVDSHGVLHGNLYLRGGGDPTFGDRAFIDANYAGVGTSVGMLANRLIARLHLRMVRGSVVGDGSYFDARRGGPSNNFGVDPNLVGELSALSFNRGASGDEPSPEAYSALRLAEALRARGIPVTGRSHAGATRFQSAQLVASVQSPTMAQLAALTALPSDDYFAEMLLKQLGARFGSGGSTAAGAVVVRRFIAGLHLRASLVDGSGLSTADQTSPRDVVTLLADLSPGGVASLQRVGVALRRALPVAARSGTLAKRMKGTAAAGGCVAKTGTLDYVSDLAGWCDGEVAFAFLMNGVDVTAAQHAQDLMAIALAELRR